MLLKKLNVLGNLESSCSRFSSSVAALSSMPIIDRGEPTGVARPLVSWLTKSCSCPCMGEMTSDTSDAKWKWRTTSCGDDKDVDFAKGNVTVLTMRAIVWPLQEIPEYAAWIPPETGIKTLDEQDRPADSMADKTIMTPRMPLPFGVT
jgi:hypothetical protein